GLGSGVKRSGHQAGVRRDGHRAGGQHATAGGEISRRRDREVGEGHYHGRRQGRTMKITDVRAYPTSFPIAAANRVALGIGTAIKRDAVTGKVTTDEGIVGWGEAHHGRAHTAVAKLIETTLKQLILNQDAHDVVGVWNRMYQFQLASHGMGAGACLAMSGIDLALWDIRGKALGLPLYRLLGGTRRAIPRYPGGVSLGYQPPAQVIEEAKKSIDQGYKAIKLRLGDSPKKDIERVR